MPVLTGGALYCPRGPSGEYVFAIGDTAASKAWKGEIVPGLAPAAKQGGTYVAKKIREQGEHYLSIKDDGDGVPRDQEDVTRPGRMARARNSGRVYPFRGPRTATTRLASCARQRSLIS